MTFNPRWSLAAATPGYAIAALAVLVLSGIPRDPVATLTLLL